MSEDVTIAGLVANGTMSADMAAVLWAAVDRTASFLTVALPRLAGKSTTSNAVLALRPPDVPLHHVAGEPEVMERLARDRLGGYIVVGEFSQAPVPGYIWGEPVRRVFETLRAGYSLQTSLHADGVQTGMVAVTEGNGVPDHLASVFKLVLYIERFGSSESDYWRRLCEIYEVDEVRDGRPVGRTLFRWRSGDDSFDKVSDSKHFGADTRDLSRRADVISALVRSTETSSAAVAAAVAGYRRS